MLSSSNFNPSQNPSITIYRRTIRTEPTNYIYKQEQNDREMLKILNWLTQYNSLVELKQFEKVKKICQSMEKQLYTVDAKHRSFVKVSNLVFTARCLLCIVEGELQRAEDYLMQQENLCYQIDSPQYTAKSCLLYMSYLLKSTKQTNQDLELKKSAKPQPQQGLQKQLKSTYRKFAKIKFPTDIEYYDHRIWQDIKVIQIVVYQYILIVQLLADLKYQKINVLYECGLKIGKRLLGKEHQLVILLKKIHKIRKDTDKLIKLGNIYGSSILLSNNSSKRVRPKTLIQGKNKKMNNPEKYGYAYSRTFTEQSQLVSNPDISKSQQINHNGKSLKSKSKYNMYLEVGKNLKQKSSQYIPKKVDHSSMISSQRNNSTIKDTKNGNNLQSILEKKQAGKQSNIYLPRINENIRKRGKNGKKQQKDKINQSFDGNTEKKQKSAEKEQQNQFKPRISYLMQSQVDIEHLGNKDKEKKQEEEQQKDLSCQII